MAAAVQQHHALLLICINADAALVLTSLTYLTVLMASIVNCRWGNTLSKKLFKGKEYVLKHIRVKHAHVLEEQVNLVRPISPC